MTAGAGRNPLSLPIWIQCRRAVAIPGSGYAAGAVVGGPGHSDLGVRAAVRGRHVRVGDVELQVDEPVVGRVEDAEPVGLGVHVEVG